MSRYLKIFNDHSSYLSEKDLLMLTNISLCENENEIHVNNVKPITITVEYIGNGNSETDIITKNYNAFGQIYELNTSTIDIMFLDGNEITFSDFTVADHERGSGHLYMYSYVFGDTNNHILEIYTNGICPSFSGYNSGPGIDDLSSIKSASIPENITQLPERCFMNHINLHKVIIPNTITTIPAYCFDDCGITSIDIPNSVTSIGNGAFWSCNSLTSCTIGNGVTSIGDNAFCGCNNLTSITCNATTAPTISLRTFQDVKSNGILYVPSNSTGYDAWMSTENYYLGKYNWTKIEQ